MRAYLEVSMASARFVAPHLANKGYDSNAFLSQVTAYLHDMTGPGLGANGVRPDGKHGDERVDGASAFVPSPAAGVLLTANEVRSI